MSPNLLPPGSHPGFQSLKSRQGIYRCLLRAVENKKNPDHADYAGILPLIGSKARILLWVHRDGSLGLRLEKIIERPPHPPTKGPQCSPRLAKARH
jgi:hypothetical protein